MPPNAGTDPRDAIDDAIRANAAGVTDRGAVVTGWAVVVELMDEDGRRWLARAHAETTSPWTAPACTTRPCTGIGQQSTTTRTSGPDMPVTVQDWAFSAAVTLTISALPSSSMVVASAKSPVLASLPAVA